MDRLTIDLDSIPDIIAGYRNEYDDSVIRSNLAMLKRSADEIIDTLKHIELDFRAQWRGTQHWTPSRKNGIRDAENFWIRYHRARTYIADVLHVCARRLISGNVLLPSLKQEVPWTIFFLKENAKFWTGHACGGEMKMPNL